MLRVHSYFMLIKQLSPLPHSILWFMCERVRNESQWPVDVDGCFLQLTVSTSRRCHNTSKRSVQGSWLLLKTGFR